MNKNELDNSNIALKKIIRVSIICVFFLTSEMIGGIIANSLAIMSDAAHLFSDLLGFVISIIALWIGKKKANDKYTFGYNRAEVIGALISVITIWFLTILLIQEAVNRLIYPTEINAPVMFFTAVIGLLFNLAMIKVLHSEHGHSHGISPCNHNKTSNDKHESVIDIEFENIPEKECHNHKKSSFHNKSHSKEKFININSSTNDEYNKDSLNIEIDKNYDNIAEVSSCRVMMSDNKRMHNHNHDYIHNNNHHDHSHDNNHDHSHDNNHDHSHDNNHDHSHDNNHDHSHDNNHDHNHDHCNDENHNHNNIDKHSHSPIRSRNKNNKNRNHTLMKINDDDIIMHSHEENVNIKAVFIHIIGDIIQSVGVVIASIIIYFNPSYHIVDPLCTFLFSIIVLFTTYNITKQCLLVLLETTPNEFINVKTNLIKKFQIKDIHKFHIWSLSSNKYCISFHLVTDVSLIEIYDYLKKAYGFKEITIQIETEEESLICNKIN